MFHLSTSPWREQLVDSERNVDTVAVAGSVLVGVGTDQKPINNIAYLCGSYPPRWFYPGKRKGNLKKRGNESPDSGYFARSFTVGAEDEVARTGHGSDKNKCRQGCKGKFFKPVPTMDPNVSSVATRIRMNVATTRTLRWTSGRTGLGMNLIEGSFRVCGRGSEKIETD